MAKAHKYVYSWGNKKADGDGSMKALLGGKGAGLFDMTRAQVPVPPGLTITTEACNAYLAGGGKFPENLWDQVLETLKDVGPEQRATLA